MDFICEQRERLNISSGDVDLEKSVEKISWAYRVSNEDVLRTVYESRNMLIIGVATETCM